MFNPILYSSNRTGGRWPIRCFGASSIGRLPHNRPDIPPPAADAAHRAVVVGYGPTGRTVTRLLRENGFEPIVIDMNVNTVRELREQGVRAIYGDATHRDTLEQAGVAANNLILTSVGMTDGGETIRHARKAEPGIHVLARARCPARRPALQCRRRGRRLG